MGGTVRFHLGRRVDVGYLAGLPGIRPLVLQDDVLVARVEDAAAALEVLRSIGFPEARLDDAPRPG